METFKTEVHVPSGSNIEFELHYQEMMHRKLNLYEHTLHLQPGRLVPQLQVRRSQIMWTCTSPILSNAVTFQVDVYIFEPQGIATVKASNTFGAQFADLIKVTSTKDKVTPEICVYV